MHLYFDFILILALQPDNGLLSRITHRASLTEGELNEQAEQEPEGSPDVCNAVIKVACGNSFGTLHNKRFASGKKRKVVHYCTGC